MEINTILNNKKKSSNLLPAAVFPFGRRKIIAIAFTTRNVTRTCCACERFSARPTRRCCFINLFTVVFGKPLLPLLLSDQVPSISVPIACHYALVRAAPMPRLCILTKDPGYFGSHSRNSFNKLFKVNQLGVVLESTIVPIEAPPVPCVQSFQLFLHQTFR